MKSYSMGKRHLVLVLITGTLFLAVYVGTQSTPISRNLRAQQLIEKKNLAAARAEFDDDFSQFQGLVEQALAWRTSATQNITRLQAKTKNDVPLSAEDLAYVHEGAEIYVRIREDVLRLAHKHKYLVDSRVRIEIRPGEGTSFDWDSMRVVVDPTEEYGDLLIKQFKLSLAAALLLYDNFLVAIWPYNETSDLRTLVNFDNRNFFNSLTQVAKNYLNEEHRARVHLAIQYYNREQAWRDEAEVELDEYNKYLDTLLLGSPTLVVAGSDEWTSTGWERFNHWLMQYFDSLNIFKSESMNIVSLLVGNAVGLVETRKGKLARMSEQEVQELAKRLKPMDILLEKAPFRLTDKLIPGHYGHVAIWLGSKADLVEAGYWESDFLKPHQKSIERGYTVLEALRDGVQLSKLSHFLNVDDLAVIRKKKVDLQIGLAKAVDQLGKSYDFNFDIETDKRIVCSELIFVVYPDIRWPVNKNLGRYTISPDNVAKYVLKKKKNFEVPIFYHDGKAFEGNPFRKMAQLMEVEGIQ